MIKTMTQERTLELDDLATGLTPMEIGYLLQALSMRRESFKWEATRRGTMDITRGEFEDLAARLEAVETAEAVTQ